MPGGSACVMGLQMQPSVYQAPRTLTLRSEQHIGEEQAPEPGGVGEGEDAFLASEFSLVWAQEYNVSI